MRNPSLSASEPINDCSACVCVLECVQPGEAGGSSVLPVLQRTHGDDNEETKVLCHEVRVILNHALSCCYWNTGHPALAFVSLCVLQRAEYMNVSIFSQSTHIYIYKHGAIFNIQRQSTPCLTDNFRATLCLGTLGLFFFIPRRCNVALESSSRIGLAGGWHAWEYVMVAMELQWLIFSGPVKREMRQR